MQGIEFETDQGSTTTYSMTPKKSGMLELLSKVGVDDTATANFILLGIVAVFFGITIFLYAGIIGGRTVDPAADARAILLMQGR